MASKSRQRAHSAVMRCLVTGATGYIGGRLAPRLLADAIGCAACPAVRPGCATSRGVFSYAEMMRRYARVAGLRRRVIGPTRVLSPRLSAYWVGLATPVPHGIARP